MTPYLNGALTVVKRSNDWSDWKAYLTNDPGVWGCGRTHLEAIGDLLTAYPERFAVVKPETVEGTNER